MKNLHILQQESIDEGRLQVRVRQKNMGTPVADARVSVSYSGDPQGKIEETDTNESGSIEAVEIATPPLEYSMSPSESQPYSEVTVTVSANGYRNITVSGVEVMPDRLSIQDIELEVLDAPGNDVDNIVIPAHTLYGDYPAKIPEPEIMPVAETGEIVLNRVVIPEYVIVHDGAPSDSTAANYYVRYKDYIKNVASSEIYATWPDATIRANVLAIMSFTLNRIYTEFYRGKGYNFNITSSTAYDHKFIYGRNIYDNISLIVNEMFENYLSRPNVKQPILTQYCDGQKVSCPSWMTQWGSKSLGDQGYSAIEILRYFLRQQHVYQYRGGCIRNPGVMARLQYRHRLVRAECIPDTKTARPHRKGISGHSVYCAGWNIRTKDKGGRGKISGCIRTSGIRCGGLQYMV